MARKKFFDEEENQGQSCCQENLGTMTKSQHQLHQGNKKGPLSSLANKQSHNLNHNQSHNKKKTGALASPKSSEESFYDVLKQLSGSGLTIREMPGDGNCLFRALADQLEGHPRNHLDHRRAVVQYMRENRPDFEPFVEDDEPFEKYVQSLAQPGTFAGNDVIVAFARLHNVTVVIHQLNSPAWLIHPSKDEHHHSSREVHIAYHNGDHYNSVRKLGDESDGPANIKFSGQGHSGCTKSAINMNAKNSPPHTPSALAVKTTTGSVAEQRSNSPSRYDNMFYGIRDEDYWVKDSSDIERLVQDVIGKTGYHQDPNFVRETLIDYNFDMISTVDHIVRMNFFFCQPPESESGVESQVVSVNPTNEDMESQSVESHGQTQPLADYSVDAYGTSPSLSPKNSSEPSSTQEKSFHIMQPLDTNIEPDRQITTHLEIVFEPSASEGSSATSQTPDQENLNKGNPKKLSARQRKEMKKKERKRDSEQRKKKELDSSPSPTRSLNNVTSNTGTLNI